MTKIILSNIQLATTLAAKEISKKEYRLIARRVEKYMMRNYSLVCEVEVL